MLNLCTFIFTTCYMKILTTILNMLVNVMITKLNQSLQTIFILSELKVETGNDLARTLE